jgi:hypothetical protein
MTTVPQTQNERSSRNALTTTSPQWLALVAMIGSLLSVMATLALHVLRPYHIERYGDIVSAYGVGQYGSLFTAALLGLGLSFVTLGLGLRRSLRPSVMSRMEIVLVTLAGVGSSLVGLFPMAPDIASIEPMMRDDIPPTTSAIIHALGGLIGSVSAVAAILLLSFTFKRDDHWRSWWVASLVLGLAAVVTLAAAFFSGTPQVVPCCLSGSLGWVKALNARVFFGALAVWLLLTAARLRAMRRDAVAQRG